MSRAAAGGAFDRLLFIGVFMAGALAIVVMKVWAVNPFIIAAAVAGLMLLYVLASVAAVVVRIREDVVGDNAYYLGFLFTLVSLSYALWEIGRTREGLLVEALLANFGIALVSTITGIFLRVIVNQFRRDPMEMEREVRLELLDSANRLQGSLRGATLGFNRLRGTMTQVARESFELSLDAHADHLRQAAQEFTRSMATVTAGLKAATGDPLAEVKAQLDRQGAAIAEGTASLSRALESLAAALARAEERLGSAAAGLAAGVDAAGARTAGLERDLERMGARFDGAARQLAGAAEGLGAEVAALAAALSSKGVAPVAREPRGWRFWWL